MSCPNQWFMAMLRAWYRTTVSRDYPAFSVNSFDALEDLSNGLSNFNCCWLDIFLVFISCMFKFISMIQGYNDGRSRRLIKIKFLLRWNRDFSINNGKYELIFFLLFGFLSISSSESVKFLLRYFVGLFDQTKRPPGRNLRKYTKVGHPLDRKLSYKWAWIWIIIINFYLYK